MTALGRNPARLPRMHLTRSAGLSFSLSRFFRRSSPGTHLALFCACGCLVSWWWPPVCAAWTLTQSHSSPPTWRASRALLNFLHWHWHSHSHRTGWPRKSSLWAPQRLLRPFAHRPRSHSRPLHTCPTNLPFPGGGCCCPLAPAAFVSLTIATALDYRPHTVNSTRAASGKMLTRYSCIPSPLFARFLNALDSGKGLAGTRYKTGGHLAKLPSPRHSQTTSPECRPRETRGSHMYPATCTVRPACSPNFYPDSARHATSILYKPISQGHLAAVSNHTVANPSCATAALRCMRRDACFMSCTAGTTVLPANAVDSTWH